MSKKPGRTTREQWIAGARRMLIAKGVDGVKIDGLATQLKVTRGGFYWHFKSRNDLLDHLLRDWRDNSSAGMRAVMVRSGDGLDQVRGITRLWIEEADFSPNWDLAVRDWARTSKAAEAAVRVVDDERIALLGSAFAALGFNAHEAHIRARVMYYHQVGYYAMRVKETKAVRYAAAPTYLSILTGLPIPQTFLNDQGGEGRKTSSK